MQTAPAGILGTSGMRRAIELGHDARHHGANGLHQCKRSVRSTAFVAQTRWSPKDNIDPLVGGMACTNATPPQLHAKAVVACHTE
jgi:hypothetical protein